MAEPYNEGVPTVSPTVPANDYQRIDPQAASFGAPQAQALQRTGAELTQASGELGQTALAIQERYNQTTAANLNSQFASGIQDITWGSGDKKGVFQLYGADALGAAPKAKSDVMALRQQMLDQAPNDAVRLAFNRGSQYYLDREIDRMDSHVDAQTHHYAVASGNSIVERSGQMAANEPSQDNLDLRVREAYAGSAMAVKSAMGANAEPAVVEAALTKAAGVPVYKALDSLANTNPAAARQALKTWTVPSLDGKSRVPVGQVLDENGRSALEAKIEKVGAQGEGLTAAYQSYTDARGSLENNVGNMRASPTSFRRYATPEAGVSDAVQNLKRYANQAGGSISLEAAITKWAPPSENNTAAYIADMARKTGLKPGDAIPLNDPAAMVVFMKAMTSHEKGRVAFGDDVFQRGVNAALGGGSPPPTTNDSAGPISGTARIQALDALMKRTDLSDAARASAYTHLETMFNQHDRAYHADSQAAFNEYVPLIATNPAGFNASVMWNDPRLTGEQKENLNSLANGRKDGDGAGYSQAYQMVFAPPGTPGRINREADIIPLAGQGVNASGMTKLAAMIKLRDQPDGPVMAAAIPGWKMQIERQAKDQPGFNYPAAFASPVAIASFAKFTADLPGLIEEARGKGMSMAEIVGPNGPIAKVLPHYQLSAAERNQPIMTEAAPAAAALRPAGNPVAAQSLVVGRWYMPSGTGGYIEVPAGTPDAGQFKGMPGGAPPAGPQ